MAVLLACTGSTKAATPVMQSNPVSYAVTLGASFHILRGSILYLSCSLPVPESDEYHDVTLEPVEGGEMLRHPENGERYLYAALVEMRTFKQNTKRPEFKYNCTVTLYDIETDFSSVSSTAFRYRESESVYRRYTGPSEKYVIPRHPRIARMADAINGGGKDRLAFVRDAYEYVAGNFAYTGEEGTLPELERVFRQNGGGSAALSSLYISLLRYKGIPARHVVGRRPDGRTHVFAEFYAEGYGWIPVDVTLRAKRGEGDYFGRIHGEDRVIVLSRDICLSIQGMGEMQQIPMMNGYAYQVHDDPVACFRATAMSGKSSPYDVRHKEIFLCKPR